MAVILERYYDRQTVSNIFAVGERIEWEEYRWFDAQNDQHVVMGKGVIEHIRSRVVIIAQELADGTVQHWRIERYYLHNWILDETLQAAINVWEGTHLAPRKETRFRARLDVPRTVYGMVDPRDGLVFYIGVTANIQRRYKQHLKCDDFNFKKNAKTQEILAEGVYPEIILIEENVCADMSDQRETHWIQFYLDLDAPLTNFAKMRGVSHRDIW